MIIGPFAYLVGTIPGGAWRDEVDAALGELAAVLADAEHDLVRAPLEQVDEDVAAKLNGALAKLDDEMVAAKWGGKRRGGKRKAPKEKK